MLLDALDGAKHETEPNMSIIEKLLGRRKRTATVIADEIAKQHGLIAVSRARIETAQTERKAALEALDSARLKAVDEAMADAGREIELHEHAIGALEAAHATQVAVEAREALDREIAEAERESAALSARVKRDYEQAAATLGAIARDLRTYQAKSSLLEARAKELGVPCAIESPENFRRGDAGTVPLTLAHAIGNLPALYSGGADVHPAPRSEHVIDLMYPELAMRKGQR